MVALDIVRGAVDLTGKTVIPVRFSMTRDAECRAAEHASLVRELVVHLDAARDVALLNLGDPSVFATFRRHTPDVRACGFEARAIPGVPSFCAVAAALERDLTPEMSSPLHIVPSGYAGRAPRDRLAGDEGGHEGAPLACGTRSASFEEGAFDGAELVEDCGLPGERVYHWLDVVPIGVALSRRWWCARCGFACIAFTERGYALAERTAHALSDCAQTGEDDPGWDVSVSRGFGEGEGRPARAWTALAWEASDALLFVGAAGARSPCGR